jgi:hypothetical protein
VGERERGVRGCEKEREESTTERGASVCVTETGVEFSFMCLRSHSAVAAFAAVAGAANVANAGNAAADAAVAAVVDADATGGGVTGTPFKRTHLHALLHSHTYIHTYTHACIHTYMRTFMF